MANGDNTTISTTLILIDNERFTSEDVGWILRNAFLVFTMQSGFCMLEAGCVSTKNMTSITAKNVIDICFGGICYWLIGYELSFGRFASACQFGLAAVNDSAWLTALHSVATTEVTASRYTNYFFHFAIATTATTIVSGAVAERIDFIAYIIYSMVNTLTYCVSASWVWSSQGFLRRLGFFDFAGACAVHLSGGASALVAAWIIGPRLGRFAGGGGGARTHQYSSPVTLLLGTFILWWGWLGFNCGSTLGLSDGRWKVAALVGVNTIHGSIGGGVVGTLMSVLVYRRSHFDMGYLSTSILSGLVGVTGGCSVIAPHEALICGAVAALLALLTAELLPKIGIDDPVNAIPVHLVAALVGTVAVGVFGRNPPFDVRPSLSSGRQGVWHGRRLDQLLVQLLGVLCVAVWSATTTAACFGALHFSVGLRVPPEEELVGGDFCNHGVLNVDVDVMLRVVAAMKVDLPKADIKRKRRELRGLLAQNYGSKQRAAVLAWVRDNLLSNSDSRNVAEVWQKVTVGVQNMGISRDSISEVPTAPEAQEAVDSEEEDGAEVEDGAVSRYNGPGVPVGKW